MEKYPRAFSTIGCLIIQSLLSGKSIKTLKGTVRQNELETGKSTLHPCRMTKHSPFRYFKTSPEIIRLAVMLYVRFPLKFNRTAALTEWRQLLSA